MKIRWCRGYLQSPQQFADNYVFKHGPVGLKDALNERMRQMVEVYLNCVHTKSDGGEHELILNRCIRPLQKYMDEKGVFITSSLTPKNTCALVPFQIHDFMGYR